MPTATESKQGYTFLPLSQELVFDRLVLFDAEAVVVMEERHGGLV
jgi:hypothetical protein